MECCWKKRHVLLCHIQTWHLFLSCLSFAQSGISFRSSISCQSLTLTSTTCCNLFQWLVTFRFVLKFTYPLQSGVFISSSFSCQVFMLTGFHLFHWQVEQSVCSYLSPLQIFPAFARLSLLASLVLSSYRQSGSAVKQDLCRLLYSARLHNC